MTFLLILSLLAATSRPHVPLVRVAGPTVIAFFVATGSEDADALDDFQWYAREVRRPFARAGIKFVETYARSFDVRVNGKIVRFHPKVPVGYFFIMPGKRERVHYGVDTSEGLFEIARAYFGITVTK